MTGTPYIINANSSQAVTDGIAEAVAALKAMGTPIDCLTLAEGPSGIESQSQADETIAPMLRLAASLDDCRAATAMALGRIALAQTHRPQRPGG